MRKVYGRQRGSKDHNGKKMSRRVGQKAYDWVKLASRVPEEAKGDFSAFRARHESYRARYLEYMCVFIYGSGVLLYCFSPLYCDDTVSCSLHGSITVMFPLLLALKTVKGVH